MNENKKIFKRQGFIERGHFPNRFTIFPIQQIDIEENLIRLHYRKKLYSYLWNEIVSAKLITKKKFKSYGRAAIKMKMKTIELAAVDGNKFLFDVSMQFSDFKNTTELIREIEKKVDLKKEEKKDYSEIYDIIIVIMFIAIFSAVRSFF